MLTNIQMKVFQINVVANSGSTGTIAEGIAATLMQDGWDCYTAYGRWANPSKTNLYRIGNSWDIYCHYLLSRIYGKHGMGSVRATKRLIKEIRKIKPDLIHLHNIHGYYVSYPLLFQYLSSIDVPVVWTLHDCWAYTGHCVHYAEVKCQKWVNGCFDCPCLSDYPKSFRDNSEKNYFQKKKSFTSLRKMTIVPVSRWLGEEVRRSFLSVYPIKVIRNGVDVTVFHPVVSEARRKYGIGKRFFILGVATRWNERKGLADFRKLSKLLDDDEVILLVGLDKKQIASLPSNIIGLQKTEDVVQLVELYSSADLFINFSTEETFGMTTLESMACGTPVLVYNSTACPEIVRKETGFVVEPHDVVDSYRKVRTARKVGKEWYSSACVSYVEKEFKKEDRYREYADLYNECCSHFLENNSDL